MRSFIRDASMPLALALVLVLALHCLCQPVSAQSVMGRALAEAVKSDFFQHFHFQETGRNPTKEGTLVRFATAVEGHEVLAECVISPPGLIQGMVLAVPQSFARSPKGNPLARDVVASFMRANCSDEILCARKKYKVVTMNSNYNGKEMGEQKFLVADGEQIEKGSKLLFYPGHLPVYPDAPSGPYLVFEGKEQRHEMALKESYFAFSNSPAEGPKGLPHLMIVARGK